MYMYGATHWPWISVGKSEWVGNAWLDDRPKRKGSTADSGGKLGVDRTQWTEVEFVVRWLEAEEEDVVACQLTGRTVLSLTATAIKIKAVGIGKAFYVHL